MNYKSAWRGIVITVFICSIVQFSPWVLEGKTNAPYFLGMPFTLWFGILISLLIVLLTALGGYVFSRLKSDELKEE